MSSSSSWDEMSQFFGFTKSQSGAHTPDLSLDLKFTDIAQDGIIIPGFVDLQVNGGGGLMFNQVRSLKELETICTAHALQGTSALLATLITSQPECMRRVCALIEELLNCPYAQHDYPIAAKLIRGVHFEGPHLSPAKAGIHTPTLMVADHAQLKSLYENRRLGKRMLTLAPEVVDIDTIEYLSEIGNTIFLGHSDCSLTTAIEAFRHRAQGVTHLFNAMSGFHHREPGLVAAVFSSSFSPNGFGCRPFASLIFDTYHVDVHMAQLALDVMGSKRLFLVSDAMAIVEPQACSTFRPSDAQKEEPKQFQFGELEIESKNGRLSDQYGRLAGSSLSMHRAVMNTWNYLQLDLIQLFDLSIITPMQAIGSPNLLNTNGEAEHQLNDFVVLNDDLSLRAVVLNNELLSS